MSIYASLDKAERLIGKGPGSFSDKNGLSVDFDEKLRKNKKLSHYFTTEYYGNKKGLLKIQTHEGQKWDVLTGSGSDLTLVSKGEVLIDSKGNDFKEFSKLYDAFIEVQKLYRDYYNKFFA